jgi:ABC-type antimicrobial peptide transport system permease subunit
MDRLGRYSLIAGLVITVVGLIFGFYFMFTDSDELAEMFLMAVPLGFLITFAGLSTVVMFSPRDSDD